ncbi:Inorganic phosphate transporter pho84 [Friedmanniomyces endolithicus]|nr:Inorganic phosphate transporter pho84 [Friedmanniomyces endolithicus]KAK0822774.1 Inorganic phosphate transporter pho84 [Friedmanniomyces endolithicus]
MSKEEPSPSEDNGQDISPVEHARDTRRLALRQIDDARIGPAHIRAVIVAGSGFFTDAYDLFSANFIVNMIGLAYYEGGVMSTGAQTAIKLSTTAGAVIGQVIFGWLADRLGRKKMYGVELIVILIGTLGQAIAGNGPGIPILATIFFGRVIMGIGVGGDYPLSSIITSEFATVKWRGALMNSVFAMQGFGNLAAALVSFVCVAGFKHAFIGAGSSAACYNNDACRLAADKTWRTIVAFGALPALAALYFHLTIPETPRYTLDVGLDEQSARADIQAYLAGKRGGKVDVTHAIQSNVRRQNLGPKAAPQDFWAHFRQWRYGKILLGTAGSWFFIDIAFWGLGLNNSAILHAIGYASQKNVYYNLYNTAVGNLILALAGSIPGYWVSVATIDTVGRWPIQMGSFIVLTVLFCIIGFAYHHLTSSGLLALYVLCQFFSNFGANSTTFIVPGEIFPTRFRSTAHGLSAAAGKIGAVIAQALLGPLANKGGTNKWLNHVMEIFAAFMLCGVGTTLLIPETKRKSLEYLAHKYHDEPMDATAADVDIDGAEMETGRDII